VKVYVDDIRNLPYTLCVNDWILARSYDEAIEYLKTGEVTELSLDHDLGEGPSGYDILLWIEEKVVKEEFIPPTIYIHTMNSAARYKMKQVVDSILRHRRK